MAIGKKVGSLKNLKNTLKKGAMGPIRYIPKNGSITVRFLEEPENWVNYNEHYDTTLRKSYPCIEDNCPGCQTEERRTSRYLCNALDVEGDRVIALQMPKDLTNTLVRKYERYDTLMDRDYTLLREGEGLDTTYDAEAEPPLARKLTKYTLLDLQKVLDDVFQSVFGDVEDDDDDEDEVMPARKATAARATRKKSASAPKKAVVEDDDDEDDEDEEDEPPRRKKKSRFAPPARDEEDDEDDEDEDEEDELDEDDDDDDEDDDEELEDEDEEDELDEDDDDDEDDDEELEDDELDEDELTAMTLGQLRILAKDFDIDTKGLKKAEIIDALLEGE